MKVNIDIECSPEEARAFLGLPDVGPLNERMVEEMIKRMETNMESMEPEALMRQWSAFGGQMTDHFMGLMRTAAGSPGTATKK